MRYTDEEIMDFIEENNVKFIRLAFCDIYGTQKNISIMPTELSRTLECGMPFDASAICGFGDFSRPDLLLFPDLSTLSLLPWRPSAGRVCRFFCDIKYPDGTPFELDSRYILRRATDSAREAGISCNVGAECEFYIFKNNENGEATRTPFDLAGYMDIAPEDKGENVRREICLTLEEMGISPESSHHEEGPGQNEIDFRYNDAMLSADDVTTFKMVVKTIAARNGLNATFEPKPLPDECGNGYHINLCPSLRGKEGDVTDDFVAGIMTHICEMTAFLNPTEESYERLGSYKAPKYVSWSQEDRSHLIRLLTGGGRGRRIEVRSPDSTANPYIATALLIYAGLWGIENKPRLPLPININLRHADKATKETLLRLPETLEEANRLALQSVFIRNSLPAELIREYCGEAAKG